MATARSGARDTEYGSNRSVRRQRHKCGTNMDRGVPSGIPARAVGSVVTQGLPPAKRHGANVCHSTSCHDLGRPQ